MLWLCHSDARRVGDLPEDLLKGWRVYHRGSETRKERDTWRQVGDLPRIRVAEPYQSSGRDPVTTEAVAVIVIVQCSSQSSGITSLSGLRPNDSDPALSCNRVHNQCSFPSDSRGQIGYHVSNPRVRTLRLAKPDHTELCLTDCDPRRAWLLL